MFFYISGMSATFLNMEEHNYKNFIINKTKRLILPMVYAIFALLIPRLYLSQDYEPWTRYDEQNVEHNYLKFMIMTLPQIYNKLSWLWFLYVLFFCMIINYPFLTFSVRRRNLTTASTADETKLVLGQLGTLLVWALIALVFLEREKVVAYFIP